MVQHLNRWLRHVPVWAVWLAGLIPLGLLVWDTLQGNLGVDPVRDIEHRLGRTAIYFLLATLAVTPLLRLTRLNLMRFRQALGLICFAYVACHLAAWVVFDMAFLWAQMLRDVVKRPYLVFGMLDTKTPLDFLSAFAGLAGTVRTVAIPDEAHSLSAAQSAGTAQQAGLAAEPADSVAEAVADILRADEAPARILICGSLYLAGHVLAENG